MADIKTLIQSIIDATSAALAEKPSVNLSTGAIIHRAYSGVQRTAEDTSEQPALSNNEPNLLAFVHALVNKLRTLPGKLDKSGPSGEPSILAQLQNLKSKTSAQGIIDALQDAKLTQAFQAISHLTDGQLNYQINKLAAMTDKQISAARKVDRKKAATQQAQTVTDALGKQKKNTAIRFGFETDNPKTVKAETNGKPSPFFALHRTASLEGEEHRKTAEQLALLLGPLAALNNATKKTLSATQTTEDLYNALKENRNLQGSLLLETLVEFDDNTRNNFLTKLKPLIQNLPAWRNTDLASEMQDIDNETDQDNKDISPELFEERQAHGTENIFNHLIKRGKNFESISTALQELAGTSSHSLKQDHIQRFQQSIISPVTQWLKPEPDSAEPSKKAVEQELAKILEPIAQMSREEQQALFALEPEEIYTQLQTTPRIDKEILDFLKHLDEESRNNFLNTLKQLTRLPGSKEEIIATLTEAEEDSDTQSKVDMRTNPSVKTAEKLTIFTSLAEQSRKHNESIYDHIIKPLSTAYSRLQAVEKISTVEQDALKEKANNQIKKLARQQFPHDWRARKFTEQLIRRLFFYKVRGENTPLFASEKELEEQASKAKNFIAKNKLPSIVALLRDSISDTEAEYDFIENHIFSSLIFKCTPPASTQTRHYDSAAFAEVELDSFVEPYKKNHIADSNTEANQSIEFIKSEINKINRQETDLLEWTEQYLLTLPNSSIGQDPKKQRKQKEFTQEKYQQRIAHLAQPVHRDENQKNAQKALTRITRQQCALSLKDVEGTLGQSLIYNKLVNLAKHYKNTPIQLKKVIAHIRATLKLRNISGELLNEITNFISRQESTGKPELIIDQLEAVFAYIQATIPLLKGSTPENFARYTDALTTLKSKVTFDKYFDTIEKALTAKLFITMRPNVKTALNSAINTNRQDVTSELYTQIKQLIANNLSTPDNLNKIYAYLDALTSFACNASEENLDKYISKLEDLPPEEGSNNFLTAEKRFFLAKQEAVNTRLEKAIDTFEQEADALDQCLTPLTQQMEASRTNYEAVSTEEPAENASPSESPEVTKYQTSIQSIKTQLSTQREAHITLPEQLYSQKNKALSENNNFRREKIAPSQQGGAGLLLGIIVGGAVIGALTAGFGIIPYTIACTFAFSAAGGIDIGLFSYGQYNYNFPRRATNNSIETTYSDVQQIDYLQTEKEALHQPESLRKYNEANNTAVTLSKPKSWRNTVMSFFGCGTQTNGENRHLLRHSNSSDSSDHSVTSEGNDPTKQGVSDLQSLGNT